MAEPPTTRLPTASADAPARPPVIARNIAANALGGALTMALTLLAVPVQTRLLGVETYGLLAFMASLQALASLLDLGLGTTALRELASDHSPGRQVSAPLIAMLHGGYWGLGLIVGALLVAAAPVIATRWMHHDGIDPGLVTWAIGMTGVTLAIRWPVAFYAGVLTGIQRLEVLNLLKITVTVLRLGGGITVLVVWPQLAALLMWLLAVAVLEVALMAAAARRLLPAIGRMPRWDSSALARTWRYAAAVNVIALQSIVVTQADRLLLGRLATREELGHYAVAYNLAMGISLIQGFVTAALMPALSADASAGRQELLRQRFEKGTQVLLFTTALPAGMLMFFSPQLLAYFLPAPVAAGAAPIMAWLAVGFLLSVVSAMPFVLALAVGRTRPALIINTVVPLAYLPALWLLIDRLGGLGCAYAWAALGLVYTVVFPPLVLGPVLGCRTLPWLARCVLPFAMLSVSIFATAHVVVVGCSVDSPLAIAAILAVGALAFVLGGFRCLDADLRGAASGQLRRLVTR
jgi:O-antigen/teichoic acid export membrane protein